MGCHLAKYQYRPQPQQRTPRTPRPHRGVPPAKIYLRGTSELACDGTFKRIYPNPKGQLASIPRLLVLYVNKRGYTITNCRTSDKTPKLHLKMWTIGKGRYPKRPWKGLFVATHRRYYQFDKKDESKSIKPPVVGWFAMDSALDEKSCPLIAYNRKGDHEIRHKSFRITHGLEDPPEAPTLASFPARVSPPRLAGISEEEEQEKNYKQQVRFQVHEEEEDVDTEDGLNSISNKSQFVTSRQFAEPATSNNTKNQRKKQRNVLQEEKQKELVTGQFESYRSSVQTMKESNASSVSSELQNIYKGQGQKVVAVEKEETEEEKGFKSRTPTNENEPIITGANRALVEKNVEQIEFERRKNVMFEMQQQKWKENEKANNKKNQKPRSKSLKELKNNLIQLQSIKSTTPVRVKQDHHHHHHHHHKSSAVQKEDVLQSMFSTMDPSIAASVKASATKKKKKRRAFASPANSKTEPQNNYNTNDNTNTTNTTTDDAPKSPQKRRSKGLPIPPKPQPNNNNNNTNNNNNNNHYNNQISNYENDLHQREQSISSNLSNSKSNQHTRLKQARQKRKEAHEKMRVLKTNAEKARTKAMKMSGTTADERAANQAETIAKRAEYEVQKLKKKEQELESFVVNDRQTSHHKLQLALEKKKLMKQEKKEQKDKSIALKKEKNEKNEKRMKQIVAKTNAVSAFADITSNIQQRTNEVFQHEKDVEKVLKRNLTVARSDSHNRLMAKRLKAHEARLKLKQQKQKKSKSNNGNENRMVEIKTTSLPG